MLCLSTRLLVLLACIPTIVTSKPLEHAQFNAAIALQSHGFQVDQYSDLASLASTSSNRACEITVSCDSHQSHAPASPFLFFSWLTP